MGLKSWGTRYGVQILCSSGEPPGQGSIPSCLYGGVLGMGFMVRPCLRLSSLFQWGYFLVCCMYKKSSAIFWISFRKKTMYSGTISIPIGESSSGMCYCHHLGPEPPDNFLILYNIIQFSPCLVFSKPLI